MSDQDPQGFIDLKPQERAKCEFFLLHLPEQESIKLTKLTTGTGDNSFKSVKTKILLLQNTSDEQQEYDEAISLKYVLNEAVASETIVNKTVAVRRKLKLPLNSNKLTTNCVADFKRLFVYSTISKQVPVKKKDGSTGSKAVVTHYIPIFRLKLSTTV